jgi:phosphatidylserine decarboxylase
MATTRPSRLLDRVFQQEDVNFILTNRIPRRLATRFMGWFSQVRQPLVRDASLAVWQMFGGPLDLHEAEETRFDSLHDCFVRRLKPDARPIHAAPGVLVSPCDGIVSAAGRIDRGTLIQAKGLDYTLEQLAGDATIARTYGDGCFVTLRLTSTMYHRFHAPDDCEVDGVTYIAGDTFNVNPIAMKRIERLYCRNERAIVPLRLNESREAVTLVPVAAILVAGIHLNFADVPLTMHYRGPRRLTARVRLRRGDEMGHFRHGSTIVVLGTSGLDVCAGVHDGARVRMGEPLLRHRREPPPDV